jgi:Kef-type K+ transport system membrane component KefB
MGRARCRDVPAYVWNVFGDYTISDDAVLVIIFLVLIVVPRALQRYRIPGAITSLALGFATHHFDLIGPSPALRLLSTLGIVALFLFAGLEINGAELRRHARILIQHGAIWTTFLVLTAFAAAQLFAPDPRAAMLIALALLTPSTGFILSTLHSGGYTADEQFAIKTKAISAELLALLFLFAVMQSASARQFGLALLAMAAIVVVIPLTFRFFAAVVLPYAPRSEFAFLLGVALVTALITRELGVYYLLGAFLVGIAAQRFRANLPALSSEKMVDALEAFGSVFIPFYFFVAGTHIDTSQTTGWAFALGGALLAVFVPVRIGITMLHRRWALREAGPASRRVATALVPTLVFTLVLAEILRDGGYGVADYVIGGLIVYTVVNTTVPAFVAEDPPPEFEAVEAPDTSPDEDGASRVSPQPDAGKS